MEITDAILHEIESAARLVLVKPDRNTSATAYQTWLANIKKFHRAIEPGRALAIVAEVRLARGERIKFGGD